MRGTLPLLALTLSACTLFEHSSSVSDTLVYCPIEVHVEGWAELDLSDSCAEEHRWVGEEDYHVSQLPEGQAAFEYEYTDTFETSGDVIEPTSGLGEAEVITLAMEHVFASTTLDEILHPPEPGTSTYVYDAASGTISMEEYGFSVSRVETTETTDGPELYIEYEQRYYQGEDGQRLDGSECLPSCGDAGGDTCAAAGSNMCDGLALLDSYDCDLCCDRSVYGSTGPHSFHIIDRADIYAWDSARAIAESNDATLICSQNRPDDLAHAYWAQKINATWYANGQSIADAIHTALSQGEASPRMVMIDELNSSTIDLIAEAATVMNEQYPQWVGRWGAFIVNGTAVSYARLNPAIDALFEAQATMGVELYVRQSEYCASGSTAGARDVWLAEFYNGSSSLARMNWLMARRAYKGSSSHISVLFGVADTYMNGTNPGVFLDRMFYVFLTRTYHDWMISMENGGPGAWKWDDPAMSNTSRDASFAASYGHYVVNGSQRSRLGQVSCD
jgi:hypothetical protein